MNSNPNRLVQPPRLTEWADGFLCGALLSAVLATAFLIVLWVRG